MSSESIYLNLPLMYIDPLRYCPPLVRQLQDGGLGGGGCGIFLPELWPFRGQAIADHDQAPLAIANHWLGERQGRKPQTTAATVFFHPARRVFDSRRLQISKSKNALPLSTGHSSWERGVLAWTCRGLVDDPEGRMLARLQVGGGQGAADPNARGMPLR